MTVIILCMRCFHAREQEEIKHHRHPSIQPRRTSAREGSLLFLYPTSLCAAHCPTPPLFCSTVNYLVFIRGRFLNVQFLTRNAMRRCTAWDRERFVAMDYKKWGDSRRPPLCNATSRRHSWMKSQAPTHFYCKDGWTGWLAGRVSSAEYTSLEPGTALSCGGSHYAHKAGWVRRRESGRGELKFLMSWGVKSVPTCSLRKSGRDAAARKRSGGRHCFCPIIKMHKHTKSKWPNPTSPLPW